MADPPWRWLPFVWQVGGGLATVYGFAVAYLSLADVGLNLAILSGITAVYLLAFIRDSRRPEDLAIALVYSLWTFGFALISLPDRIDFGGWTPAAYTLGALAIVVVLPLTWLLYVEFLAE